MNKTKRSIGMWRQMIAGTTRHKSQVFAKRAVQVFL
jgi:hypothetical protein